MQRKVDKRQDNNLQNTRLKKQKINKTRLGDKNPTFPTFYFEKKKKKKLSI